MESEQLKKKFGGVSPKQSALLRKKLQGEAKYFDSGDYGMAKQKKDVVVGATPTISDGLLPQRKKSTSKMSGLVDYVHHPTAPPDSEAPSSSTSST